MNNPLEKTIQLIDQANAADPHDDREALYAKRMLETLRSFDKGASDSLTLACYAQHVCRWKLSRKDYPEGLKGYLTWRTDLAKLHAKILANAMRESGYSDEKIEQASRIIQKKKLKTNAESQTLEDVSCLVFLGYYFEPFADKYPDEKVIDIVQKTWGKMSPQGHEAALQLTLPSRLNSLVAQALK